MYFFFFSSRRRHTRLQGDWSSDVCSSDLLDGRTKVNIEGQDRGKVWVGDGSEISADVQVVPPTLLGRNVRIKSGAVVGPYAVIGDNAIIEENAVVHRSVLWDNVYVGAGTHLTAC